MYSEGIYSHDVHPTHPTAKTLALVGALVCLMACSDPPASTIPVIICGDLVVPDEVDAIRLTVLDPDRKQVWTSLDELAVPTVDAARFDFAFGEAGVTVGDGGVDGGDAGDAALDAADEDPEPDAEPSDGGAGDGGPFDGEVPLGDGGADAGPEGPGISLVEHVPSARGRIWIQVQGLKDGVGVVTAEVRPGKEARVALTRACVGVQCMAGLTCLDGQCVQVPPAMECP